MSKKLDVQKINSILENLDTYNLGKKYKLVSETESKGFHAEKDQGDTGERVLIYDVGDDLFLRVVEESDSYGYESGIISVKFVQKLEKTVTVYE